MPDHVFSAWRTRVEAMLDRSLPPPDLAPRRLHAAMRHAVLNGGKRMRPLLVYASGVAMGARDADLDAAAAAVELVGAWHWGPSRQELRADGEGGLVLGLPGQGRGSRFRVVGPDEWVGLDGYYAAEPLRVVRDAAGEVSHLDLASFRLTREPYDPGRDVPGGVDVAGWH